jgi:hypothetical protein
LKWPFFPPVISNRAKSGVDLFKLSDAEKLFPGKFFRSQKLYSKKEIVYQFLASL